MPPSPATGHPCAHLSIHHPPDTPAERKSDGSVAVCHDVLPPVPTQCACPAKRKSEPLWGLLLPKGSGTALGKTGRSHNRNPGCVFFYSISACAEACFLMRRRKNKPPVMRDAKGQRIRPNMFHYRNTFPSETIYEDLDASEEETKAVNIKNSIITLQMDLRHLSDTIGSYGVPMVMQRFGDRAETFIQTWYNSTLQETDRFSLPLYERAVDDAVYYAVIEQECAMSLIPFITTLAAYREFLILAQCYLPKQKDFPCNYKEHLSYWWSTGKLLGEDQMPEDIKKEWYERFNHTREWTLFDGSEEEYRMLVYKSMTPGNSYKEVALFQSAVNAAINTVRLLQFLRSSPHYACFFDLSLAMNAYNVLLLSSRLLYEDTEEHQSVREKIRAKLAVCFAMIQSEYNELPSNSRNSTYMETMELEARSEVNGY
ncbi:hypothetical protein BDF14DRAFT_1742522 [Spinellus fusiger]|nr:hypothetical protein BDF14DRAFT_1742522 [Spinellus fusiger]